MNQSQRMNESLGEVGLQRKVATDEFLPVVQAAGNLTSAVAGMFQKVKDPGITLLKSEWRKLDSQITDFIEKISK